MTRARLLISRETCQPHLPGTQPSLSIPYDRVDVLVLTAHRLTALPKVKTLIDLGPGLGETQSPPSAATSSTAASTLTTAIFLPRLFGVFFSEGAFFSAGAFLPFFAGGSTAAPSSSSPLPTPSASSLSPSSAARFLLGTSSTVSDGAIAPHSVSHFLIQAFRSTCDGTEYR